MKNVFYSASALLLLCMMAGCKEKSVNIDCEKYTLANGLQVVLQQDHSDPVVAVAIQYHVGSAREHVGKTGFAHFFEHMLFQRSENLSRNAFFNKISELGGDFNGSTDCDATRYHEIVPRDALEKVLWMESDRMGYFINTVTQGGLEREIDVVSNEKRQMYDTRPYGQLIPIWSRYAFPEGHPYSWTTIGELNDLRAATVDDVKKFYKDFYKPNNATLVISGDFDSAEAKAMVDKYFGEIPEGDPVVAMKPQPVKMDSTVNVVYQDDYASMPLLAMVFPAPEKYGDDTYALKMLSTLLSEGKSSPLHKVLVDGKKLSPGPDVFYWDRELAGNFVLIIPAFEGCDLNVLRQAVDEAFALFEKEGIAQDIIEGAKAVSEVSTFNRMGGVLNRALTMAEDNVFAGDPLQWVKELERYKAVTPEQVMAAYNKYIKGANCLQISIVPKGAMNLALKGSHPAVVSLESIAEQKMKSEEGKVIDDPYEHSASKIDRSVEPALLANTPEMNPPHIWKHAQGADSFNVWGATNSEMPLVRFLITLKGGQLFDSPSKPGVASLYAETLFAGTSTKTPEELEAQFRRLGVNVNCEASTEEIEIQGTCLKRNLTQTIDLISEVLTSPRFDENEIENARKSTLAYIATQDDDTNDIAKVVMRKLLYGQSILSNMVAGNIESVTAINIDDLKAYHENCISPSVADIHFAGDITSAEAQKAVAGLASAWKSKAVKASAEVDGMNTAVAGKIYFIDQPGAQQSVILAAAPAMPRASEDYYPAVIANHNLGDGSHSKLFSELRLKRGYTYGAYSSLNCGNQMNRFNASSKVQGIKTKESLDVLIDVLKSYPANFTDEDMEYTRSSMFKANFGAYETLGSLVYMLNEVSVYGLPEDYVKQREALLRGITTEQVRSIAQKYFDPAKMTYLIVGDASSQLARLKGGPMGDPIVLDKKGNPIK